MSIWALLLKKYYFAQHIKGQDCLFFYPDPWKWMVIVNYQFFLT